MTGPEIAQNDVDARLELGEAARRNGRLEDARRHFAAAAKACFRPEDMATRAHVLTRQAQVERDLGNISVALAFQTTAVRLQREPGVTHETDGCLAHSLRHLAELQSAAGQRAAATASFAEMESLYRRGNGVAPLDMANAVRSLAAHAEFEGNVLAARRLWTEARERYAELGALFFSLTGVDRNPGVEEADARLAALNAQKL